MIARWFALIKVLLILGSLIWASLWVTDLEATNRTTRIVLEHKIMNYEEALGDDIHNSLRKSGRVGTIIGLIGGEIASILIEKQIQGK